MILADPNDVEAVSSSISKDFLRIAFHEFLDERKNIKYSIYLKVSILGLATALISSLIFMTVAITPAGSALILSSHSQGGNVILIIQAVTTFVRVVGICIFSAVPTSELDVLEIFVRRQFYRVCFSVGIAIGASMASFAFVYISVINFPNEPSIIGLSALFYSLPIVLLGFSFLLSCKQGTSYAHLQRNVKLSLLYLPYKNLISTIFEQYVFPELAKTDISFSDHDVAYFVGTIASYTVGSFVVLLYQAIIDNHFFINQMFGRQLIPPQDESSVGGKGLQSLYMLIYRIMLSYCFAYFCAGIQFSIQSNSELALFWIFLGIADILPILVAFFIGHERCFTLIARYFEYDVKRQKQDGCMMVALVKSFQVFPSDETDKSKLIFWYIRSQIFAFIMINYIRMRSTDECGSKESLTAKNCSELNRRKLHQGMGGYLTAC